MHSQHNVYPFNELHTAWLAYHLCFHINYTPQKIATLIILNSKSSPFRIGGSKGNTVQQRITFNLDLPVNITQPHFKHELAWFNEV